jgi:hypothetical protein
LETLSGISVSGDALRDRDGVERARHFPRKAIAGLRLLLRKITAEPYFADRKSLLLYLLENRRSPKPWVGDATALQSKRQTG